MGQLSRQAKQLLSLGVGTAVTIALLAWVLQDMRWADVGRSLGRSHWGWLALGWATYVISYGVRSQRWGTLLSEQGYTSTWKQRLTALFIGFGANSVLPASLGEGVRAGMLHRTANVPIEASIGSIVAERMLDVGIVIVLLVLPLSTGAVPAISTFNYAWIAGGCFGLLLLWGACIVGARHPQHTVARLAPLWRMIKRPRLAERIQTGLLHFLQGLRALSLPRYWPLLLLQTFCAWGLNGLTYWMGLLAFEIDAPGLVGALFIQSGAALAIALPSTPGYIGPFEASLRLLLGLYHISPATILSYVIAMRILMYVTIPVIALILAVGLGIVSQPQKLRL